MKAEDLREAAGAARDRVAAGLPPVRREWAAALAVGLVALALLLAFAGQPLLYAAKTDADPFRDLGGFHSAVRAFADDVESRGHRRVGRRQGGAFAGDERCYF